VIKEEYEDLSPEELAEEIGKLLDEESAKFGNTIPDELQVELRKPRYNVKSKMRGAIPAF
jgi:hypothetical protein